MRGVAVPLRLLDRIHSLGIYALHWCHGVLNRRASNYIELLSPRTTLRLVYIFHEMNLSIPGYNLSLDGLGVQSLLISEACIILYSCEENVCFNLVNSQQESIMSQVVSALTPLFLDQFLACKQLLEHERPI